MKTMAERLESLRTHRRLKQEAVEEGAGLAKGAYTRLKQGSGAGADVVSRLAKFFDVDAVWLEHGLGEAPSWLGGAPQRAPEVVVSAAPAIDPFGPARWKLIAQRYENFRIEAGLAMGASWCTEAILSAASDEIGHHKGDGPGREEARAAIFRAREGIRAYEGRPAEEADLGLEAARAVAPKPKRVKR